LLPPWQVQAETLAPLRTEPGAAEASRQKVLETMVVGVETEADGAGLLLVEVVAEVSDAEVAGSEVAGVAASAEAGAEPAGAPGAVEAPVSDEWCHGRVTPSVTTTTSRMTAPATPAIIEFRFGAAAVTGSYAAGY
jgi:hypothetical protein